MVRVWDGLHDVISQDMLFVYESTPNGCMALIVLRRGRRFLEPISCLQEHFPQVTGVLSAFQVPSELSLPCDLMYQLGLNPMWIFKDYLGLYISQRFTPHKSQLGFFQ